MRIRYLLAPVGIALVLGATPACSATSSGGGTATSSTTAAAGGGGEAGGGSSSSTLPAKWPAELALPEGTTVTQSSDLSAASMMVVARIDGDTKAVYDALKAQLTDAGYEIVGSTFTPSDKGGYGSISARGSAYTAAIAFGPNDTGKLSQVTINVAQKEP